jgi:death-on-curing protein
MTPIFLNADDVISINKKVIAKYGGIYGIRDRTLVETSVDSVVNNYHYERLGLVELSTIYALSVTQNHPFLDGNKRTALMSMLIFLDLNRINAEFSQKELEDNIVKITLKEMKREEFLEWVKKFIKP